MAKHTTTDRERVLMAIAVETAGTVHDRMKRLECGWYLRFRFDRLTPQFIPTELAEVIGLPMKPGDVVRCKTNPHHPWGIAELVECRGHSDFLLKLIGGDGLCNMGNELLDVLRFMPPALLYTGAQRRVHKWASGKAFRKPYNPDADYFKVCGGVEFEGDQLIIWSRAHIWAMEKRPKEGPTLYAHPKRFTMNWSDKTRLKDIVAAMREQGFSGDFEYLEGKPTEGQAGYAKFTREEVERTLESAGFELRKDRPMVVLPPLPNVVCGRRRRRHWLRSTRLSAAAEGTEVGERGKTAKFLTLEETHT